MLNQLIYTRCSPHRDIKNKGQVVRGDGFGVFSVSQGLLDADEINNCDLLISRLSLPNCSRENSTVGLVNSYEYISLGNGKYALLYEYARPHCKELRKNGTTHRAGTYIKQCFIGSFKGYPFSWFGSSEWDAYKKSENDYYLDNLPGVSPEIMPEINDQPECGYIDINTIRDFVSDGRSEAVKAGIWFLIREFQKPEKDRKVLLIKDTPDNIELWIAAIEYAFPAEMAQTITFATNRSKLSSQSDNVLFYYTDERGNYNPLHNRSMNQERHPYNMIVGYHPKDVYCSSLRQTASSNFVIIDGVTKTYSFSTDDSINSPYYASVVEYGEDIFDFCSTVLSGLPINGISTALETLFSAYRYLFDRENRSDNWSYEGALNALNEFTRYGLSDNSEVNDYLIEEGLRAYKRFASSDLKKDLKMLKMLSGIADAQGSRNKVADYFKEEITHALEDLKAPDNDIGVLWHTIRKGKLREHIVPAISELFSDDRIKKYSHSLPKIPQDNAQAVIDMYFELLAYERQSLNSLLKSKEKYSFLCYAMIALIDDYSGLIKIMRMISRSQTLLNSVSVSVAKRLTKKEPEKCGLWWKAVSEVTGSDEIELCKTLGESISSDADLIESLLAGKVLSDKKCSHDALTAFAGVLKSKPKNEHTGEMFFNACIQVGSRNEIDKLIRLIRSVHLDKIAEKAVFKTADKAVLYIDNFENYPAVVKELKSWGKELELESETYAYYEMKRTFVRERDTGVLEAALIKFSQYDITLPREFVNSIYFSDIAAKTADLYRSELHIMFLCLFNVNDGELLQQYVEAYLKIAFDQYKLRNTVKGWLSLCEPFCYGYELKSKPTEYVEKVSDLFEHTFEIIFPTVYSPEMSEQVRRFTDCDEDVKNRLLDIIAKTGKNTAPRQNKSGLLTNMFGKR